MLVTTVVSKKHSKTGTLTYETVISISIKKLKLRSVSVSRSD